MNWNRVSENQLISDCGDYVITRSHDKHGNPAYSLECRGHWMMRAGSAEKVKHRAAEHKANQEKAA